VGTVAAGVAKAHADVSDLREQMEARVLLRSFDSTCRPSLELGFIRGTPDIGQE